MTENEALEYLKSSKRKSNMLGILPGSDIGNTIIKALEEVQQYKDIGIPAREAIKGPGSIEYGMKWLQVRHIVIDRARTPAAYEELSKYEYERDKDGNPISGYPDANNHIIDALRYSYEPIWRKRGSTA